MRTLVVVAHSPSAVERAVGLFGEDADAHIYAGTRRREWLRAARMVMGRRDCALYLVDIGSSTTLLAVAGRLARRPVVVDTGDLVYELERSRGARSRLGLATVRAGESITLRSAHHLVVRGRGHLDILGDRPATLAPDLAPAGARPVDGRRVRDELALADSFVIGLVGSMHRAPRLGITYGWEIVEALSQLDDRFAAVFVGDGEGRAQLERRAAQLGVLERCRFVGAVHGEPMFELVGAFDVGISTQTNDRVGAVRTTGKLPMYLACGCPVLATDVGEARRLLGPLGWTVRYDGVVDRAYPRRLAERVRQWADAPDARAAGERRRAAVALHSREFDPGVVRDRVNRDLAALLARTGG